MEIAILIVVAVLSLASLGVSLGVLIMINKRSKGGSSPLSPEFEREQIRSQQEVKSSVDNMQKTLELQMEKQIAELRAQLSEQLKNDNQGNNDRLLAFQKQLSDSVSSRFAEIAQKETSQMETITRTLSEISEKDSTRISSFQTSLTQTVSEQIKTMNEKLERSLKEINDKVDVSLKEGFKATSESMVSLQKSLGAVEEAQKNIADLKGDIASLNGILSSNQQRGRFGEWQLELLLENMFQDGKDRLYALQYQLAEGLKPDAVIFLDGEAHHQMACIDSKFSLVGYESLFDPSVKLSEEETLKAKSEFKTALKQRIEETSKYIIAGKTISNALMFIPSDGVFAFVEKEYQDLVEFAKKKGVVMVCPCILTPLLGSFRVIQIDAAKSESLSQINAALNSLADNFKRFVPRWVALNKAIQGLTKKSDEFGTTVNKIGKDFTKVANIDFSEPDEDEPLEFEETE